MPHITLQPQPRHTTHNTPGDFVYSDLEFEVVKRDVAAARKAGADGIVFGALMEDGSVDMRRMREVKKLCGGGGGIGVRMMLTFHRAFDMIELRHDNVNNSNSSSNDNITNATGNCSSRYSDDTNAKI
jgi:copper homeostasis protein CutC